MHAPAAGLTRLQDALAPEYVLESEIGRGGMATVYRAHDAKHGRSVALKVLHADLSTSEGAERFRREIAVAASLHHPSILTVLDSGATPDGQLWFSMPYVDGASVRRRLELGGALPIAEALRVALSAADALDYAHHRGVIHRDIKPENILLSGDHALVTDFGIAHLLADDANTPRDALTATGVAIGTPGYMSPEQASGLRILDARSDVFSLGLVLYEMLAAEAPSAATISTRPPSIRRVRPEVPERLDVVLRRALAPVPADRWASAGDFGAALAAVARAGRPTPVTRVRPAAAVFALGLGTMIGGTAWLAWKGTPVPAPPSVAVPPQALRLAVLPFQNVGDSSDAYFADGVTDAVRGKLAGLPGLEVIGTNSSAEYRRTTKTPQQIARELDVRYLLEGKVRWEKGPDGTSRVRVTPELVDVGTAADKWAQAFDAPLTDVFQVQSTIAGQVAQQLQVALTPAAAQTLASRPTSDVTAYEFYLRGEALRKTAGAGSTADHDQAVLFTEAVTRDSTFATAWAELASAQAQEYQNGVPAPALADSVYRNSARALALAPDLADAHTARAIYYVTVRQDPLAALREDSVALGLAPRDVNSLRLTGDVEMMLGRWDAAEAHLADAARLDPRSVSTAEDLGDLELLRGQYTRARAPLARAVMLAPTTLNVIDESVLLPLLQGDLTGARAFLRSVPSSVDRNSLVAYLATYTDLGWALDSSDAERLLGLRPDAFNDDRGAWAWALAQQYRFRGDGRRARAYADTARAAFETQLRVTPADAQRHVLLGLTLAYLGRREAAIREGQRGAALLPVARDAVVGAYVQHQLVRIYILVGAPERALDTLEALRAVPYLLSPAWLRIDPNFAPLRGNPRFERLLIAQGRP